MFKTTDDYSAVGDGTTDDKVPIQTAVSAIASAGGGTLLFTRASYALGGPVTIPANVTLDLNGSTIVGTSSPQATHFFTIASDRVRILNGKFEGSNLQSPSEPYESGLSNGTGIYITKTGSPVVGIRLADLKFADFPAGAVLSGAAATVSGVAYDLIIERCRAQNCQTHTAHATPAAFELHGCDNSRVIDCHVVGYAFKGIHYGNSSNSQMIGCHTYGGTAGNGSHHVTGGSDMVIECCSHSGAGYGFKCDDVVRPTVRGFHAVGCAGAGQFQNCIGFLGDGIRVDDPTSGLSVQGTGTAVSTGEIVNCRVRRSVAGTTSNHYGIDLLALEELSLQNVRVANCHFEGLYHGIRVTNTGRQQSGIDLIDNRVLGAVEYGIIAFIGSGDISRNRITGSGSATTAGIALATDGVFTGGVLSVDSNEISDCGASQISIVGTGARLFAEVIRVRGNTTKGGTQFLEFIMRTADVVGNLVIEDNQGQDLATRGMAVTLGTTSTTWVTLNNNDFRQTAGARITTASWTNLTNYGVLSGNFDYPTDPGGVVPAEIGRALCRRTDTGQLYVKTANTYLPTGWTALS